ncbi:phosphate/phosphite/phosphonate ABC transporter substrate-binding protein [Lysobacter sp. TY2-98]|uniref:phosphate/phosphite/phosphonate ABC transporter substrate-binding protein n=1 Tax=Lysobacter sp. TY2-98 TaxID=2290922 RepID=UPI000E206F67|nr:phosphate/phosphite/phosphonate ABC transporter substrate-binding protein [Lysobacter sp. TY2-98]AXK73547.1 phosphate/phosphite/phosphonate ABC transporter substrate-binding protein [Lysobacter sp. TY2-98]
MAPASLEAAGETSSSGVLVLGRVSDDPAQHYDQLKPLLDYVVPRMADVGIREGRILMARDPQQMASYMRRGRVDWVTETAGTAMLLNQRVGARPLLLTERDGVSRYRSVFFARRDRGLSSLDDLRGHRIAFQRPSSTSAYYVPAGELLDRGMHLEILLSPDDQPAAGSVGYLFARSELNIATWVHKGLVDAGVMSNVDWDNPARVPSTFRRDFVLIGQTPDYPRAVEVVRGDLDPRIAARLREVLLEASNDPAGREALLAFFGTTRFLPLDPASERALAGIGRGVARIKADVE